MRNQAGSREATELSIPNIITLGRILLVPVIVWAIASNQMEIAFAIFIIAGVSDAVDGFLAKRFNMASELGALLDPLADKALLVSIYIALGIWGAVPRWIVILVVSRDIMIVAAVIVSWLFGKPIPMKPLMVSKLNTVAQVAFAALVLASLGFGFKLGAIRPDPDGFCHGLYAGFRIALSRGVGAAHEYDRSALTHDPRKVGTGFPKRYMRDVQQKSYAWQARVQPRQLAFALPHAESLTRDNFLEGPANEAGLALIDSWPEWPNRIMLLVGPEGSGKSHLAAIWAEQAGARSISAHALTAAAVPGALATGALVVEDLRPCGRRRAGAVPSDESGARGRGLRPDHRARAALGVRGRIARSALAAARGAGGDAVAAGRSAVSRADRQILRGPPAHRSTRPWSSYLATRIERSYAAARQAVELLDTEALRLGRPVTRALAAELLRNA